MDRGRPDVTMAVGTLALCVVLCCAGPASAAPVLEAGPASVQPPAGATTVMDGENSGPPGRQMARTPPAQGNATGADNESLLTLTNYYRLRPGQPGTIEVRVVFDVPDSVTTLTASAPQQGRVVETTGFRVANDSTGYVWERDRAGTPSESPPSVTLRVDVNATSEAHGGYDAVDVGEWALVDLHGTDFYYFSFATERFVRYTVDHEIAPGQSGVVGERVAYLGAHERATNTTDGRRIDLVIPDSADLALNRSTVFETLFAADRQFEIGERRRDSLTVFVAPWPVRRGGRAPGAGEIVVADRSGPTDYLHQYVHTRQHWNPDRTLTWLDEASATFYAQRLALEQGWTSYDAMYRRLNDSTDDGANLTQPLSWEGDVGATEGARVVALLDARIKNESEGRRGFETVIWQLNFRDGTVTYDDFKWMVSTVAGTYLNDDIDDLAYDRDGQTLPRDPLLYAEPGRDADGDALVNSVEADLGTAVFRADTDRDGLSDGAEVRTYRTDPALADTDEDGFDDAAEVTTYDTDPTTTDTDGDGLEDSTEIADLNTDPTSADTDGDGLADDTELIDYRTDPTTADTDGDGLSDGVEVDEYGTDPTLADTDSDALEDPAEVRLGTDPTVVDTDGDSIPDGVEVHDYSTDPTGADTDGDGLDDDTELGAGGIDPTDPDTDGDGVGDEVELQRTTTTQSGASVSDETTTRSATVSPTADENQGGPAAGVGPTGLSTLLALLALAGGAGWLWRRRRR